MRKRGFTLAEVLMTLSIIGVVAALTIPSVVRDFQETQFRAAFKKIYSDYSQAHLMVVADNGGSVRNTNVVASRLNLRNAHLQYVKHVKKCGGWEEIASNGNCWHVNNNWKYMNGAQATGGGYSAVLNNGALISMGNGQPNCGQGWDLCAEMFVDVNGFKGPNHVGKDIFGIGFRKSDTVPLGRPNDQYFTGSPCSYSNTTTQGWACAYKVITNQDY